MKQKDFAPEIIEMQHARLQTRFQHVDLTLVWPAPVLPQAPLGSYDQSNALFMHDLM